MKYPFLENNELILINYPAGSSGQLLMRLWKILDTRSSEKFSSIFAEKQLTEHPASKEIEFPIHIPKRITNWFLDKNQPTEISEYANYFEFLATILHARTERHHFYKIRSNTYLIKNKVVLYGIHEETGIIPLKSLNEQNLNINIITLTSTTTESKEYAIQRGIICYGQDYQAWNVYVDQFKNINTYEHYDFCNDLVHYNTKNILNWLEQNIGEFYSCKNEFIAEKILNKYYKHIVGKVNIV